MLVHENVIRGAVRLMGVAVCGLSVAAFAASGNDNKTVSLQYETAAGSEESFPDSCGKPYQDAGQFIEFYEATLSAMVVERGPRARGVVDLFAVSELRAEMKDLFPNMSEESPIDRLIIAQLCYYQKVRVSELKPGKAQPVNITSEDAVLHNHLADIAPKMFADAKKLMLEGVAAQSRLKARKRRLAARRADIHTARELGRSKVDDLFSSDHP
jgi:hypothetical protein